MAKWDLGYLPVTTCGVWPRIVYFKQLSDLTLSRLLMINSDNLILAVSLATAEFIHDTALRSA